MLRHLFLRLFNKNERLFSRLMHPDRKVREKAREKLDEIRPSWRKNGEIDDRLMAMVNGHAGAAELLGIMGKDRAVDKLIVALKKGREDVREAAAEALGKIGNDRALHPLIEALKDKYRISKAAEKALWSFNDERAVDPLISALNVDNVYFRTAALELLGGIGDSRAIGPTISLLRHHNEHVRLTAAKILGVIGNENAVLPLIKSLEDRDRVRTEAALALGKIGDERAVEPLIRAGAIQGETMFSDMPPSVALKAIIKSNAPFRSHYPDLFCKQCRRRAALLTQSVAACPVCGVSKHLLKGITEVIGVIGGDSGELVRENHKVTVPVWIEEKRKARNADIDALVIRENGVENYHLAINALILELAENATQQPGPRIPVFIEGNPTLSKFELNLLTANFDFRG